MTRQRLFIVGMALAVAALPMSGLAAAQERTSNGNTTGSAVPRSDSGGGSAVPRSDGGGGSTGGSVGGASSGDGSSSSVNNIGNNGWTAPSSATPASSAMGAYQPPTRYSEQSRTRSEGSATSGTATPRSSGGSSSGGSAPRGSSSASSGSSSSGRSASSGSNESGSARRAVPAYSRPRGDRPVTGEAVERGTVPPAGGGGGGIIYYPYYPWGFWGPGYGFGLGYLFYDPFYGGYGYGYGDPGYGGGGGGGYSPSQSSSSDTGNVRLKINPKQAQIFVDGYYVGVVDSYDGAFQKLSLDGGDHKMELKADGYEPLQFDVIVTPGETVTYKGEMKRIK